ncbi:MAG: hypothetical protein C0598_03190 [Marinilabiliales bacterium]|nr:MAG: hypothetical protein C0598_03190 [Marinilabiliales bacterium]
MLKLQRLLLVVFLWFLSVLAGAQECRLQFLDKINNDPIAYANVLVTSLDGKTNAGYVSDINGNVKFNIKEKSKVHITYVGFKDIIDTISPGVNKTLYLESISYNVNEVVVTGQYVASRQDKSIYKVKVLNSQDISQRAAVNIKDMLSTELNIRTTHDNALGSSIKMQGLGGEHIKLLIDGVPVIGRENGNIDLDQINLQNVDHIEVINGPMSVVYGSNALAGVINIITKEPDRLATTSYLKTYVESVGMYNVDAGFSKRVKKNSVSLNLGRNFFDGYGGSDTGRSLQWIPKEQYNLSGDFKRNWGNGDIKFGVNWFSQELRDKGDLLPPYYETAFDKYFYTKRLVGRIDANHTYSKKSRINATASYSTYSKIKNTYINDLTVLEKQAVPGMQDTTRFNNILFRSSYSYGNEDSKLSYLVGLDLNHESGLGKRIKDDRQEIGDYAVFLSLNYYPISTLNIQPGLRFMYNTKFKAPLVYSLNLKYDATERLIIRGSVAKGYRAPSLKELYLEFVDINHDIHGNVNLTAESSINSNVMVQFNSAQGKTYEWGLEMNLFNNNIKDKIDLIQMLGSDKLYSYVNVNKFVTRGVELNFNNSVYPFLKVKFGFTLTGQNVQDEGITSTGFEYYNDFNTSLNYWNRKYDINFSVFYKYNGKYPQLFYSDVSEETSVVMMDSYNTLDINVNKRFWKRRLNIQVGAKNLFDVTNITQTGGQSGGIHSGGSSVPIGYGRTFFISLQLNYNK